MIESVTHTLIHKGIVKNLDQVHAWFQEVLSEIDIPIYSSFDIRDAGVKVTNVDGNIYPAGFNNICQVDREGTGELARKYLTDHYGDKIKRILIEIP